MQVDLHQTSGQRNRQTAFVEGERLASPTKSQQAKGRPMTETFYEVMRRQGITRRSYLKFCSLTAASLGMAPAFATTIAHALETKPRTPVLWLHGLECTCCTESFIRSAHPLAKDVILSMISLDYDDTIMAAAGHQAEAALEQVMKEYKGNYRVADQIAKHHLHIAETASGHPARH